MDDDGERRHAYSILKVGHEYEVLGMLAVGQWTTSTALTIAVGTG